MSMRFKPSTWLIIAAWIVLLGSYVVAALIIPRGSRLATFGDVTQCLVPLFANAGLLINAGSSHWRRNAFWMLLALGCSMWMAGQLLWTFHEVVLNQPVPNPFVGDVVFFLHTVPMIGALGLLPHARNIERGIRHGYLDFLLLLTWWVYLYAFIVLPWQYVQPVTAIYGNSYNHLYLFENIVFVIGLGVLFVRTQGPWRWVYANLFGAALTYSMSSLIINVAIDVNKYYTGSIYDIPLIASFLWFGSAGFLAYRTARASEPAQPEPSLPRALRSARTPWAARLAMAAVLSLPVMAVWSTSFSETSKQVSQFRLVITMVALVVLTSLVFIRQLLVDQERQRLLQASQESLDNLRRLQTSFAQSEKMAALGQLAAGAAREINNPLTAILGYSDLLKDDGEMPDRMRQIAGRIQDQARRTKLLVNNLLSFARQLPVEKSFLDIHSVLNGAVQLRTLDLREQNIRIELQTESVLPGLRGDPNQLLQVFYNLISNAVDAMAESRGGTLTVRALREKKNIVLEFSDSGPGIKDPSLVFDPFYSTKPAGKGSGLGLSICYGIIQDHGGHISCYNRPEGGATFRVELPAVAPVLPKLSTAGASPSPGSTAAGLGPAAVPLGATPGPVQTETPSNSPAILTAKKN